VTVVNEDDKTIEKEEV
jgi:hypothetical protein